MKTPAKALFILLALIAAHPPGTLAAVSTEPAGTMGRKFQRGLVNVALSPIEVSYELSKERRKDEYLPTWVNGLLRGSAFMGGRALSGLYDIVTFPLPVPSGYAGLLKPEFVTEHLPAAESAAPARRA